MGHSLEVDPCRLKSDNSAEIQNNRAELCKACQKIFDIILNSSFHIPLRVKQVFRELNSKTEKTFPTSFNRIIGAFFFLRFICPAIVNPEQFGILNECSLDSRRKLTLVTKLLQNIANESYQEEKEPFMSYFSTFIKSNVEKLPPLCQGLLDITKSQDENFKPRNLHSFTIHVYNYAKSKTEQIKSYHELISEEGQSKQLIESFLRTLEDGSSSPNSPDLKPQKSRLNPLRSNSSENGHMKAVNLSSQSKSEGNVPSITRSVLRRPSNPNTPSGTPHPFESSPVLSRSNGGVCCSTANGGPSLSFSNLEHQPSLSCSGLAERDANANRTAAPTGASRVFPLFSFVRKLSSSREGKNQAPKSSMGVFNEDEEIQVAKKKNCGQVSPPSLPLEKCQAQSLCHSQGHEGPVDLHLTFDLSLTSSEETHKAEGLSQSKQGQASMSSYVPSPHPRHNSVVTPRLQFYTIHTHSHSLSNSQTHTDSRSPSPRQNQSHSPPVHFRGGHHNDRSIETHSSVTNLLSGSSASTFAGSIRASRPRPIILTKALSCDSLKIQVQPKNSGSPTPVQNQSTHHSNHGANTNSPLINPQSSRTSPKRIIRRVGLPPKERPKNIDGRWGLELDDDDDNPSSPLVISQGQGQGQGPGRRRSIMFSTPSHNPTKLSTNPSP
eukprot:TRINITY_DN2922_c0_g1_i2.p1 TRINITY_DN2922_c0_g1~~TRINITY_DN2922_c0_g1_i2.p1  ORF type:complete len:664 (-),score=87.38 TRINITY_DN2922_c0_g1_i2:217-2208(-)